MNSRPQTHSARSVADFLLERAEEQGKRLTPMQVIKLVYLCHGWMLALYDRPLIDEKVQAWQYGPVIKTLYDAVRMFKSSPVHGPLSVGGEEFDPEEISIMDQVLNLYGQFSGTQLSALTHAPGTPWSIIWNDMGRNSVIPNQVIASHFKYLAEHSSEQERQQAAASA